MRKSLYDTYHGAGTGSSAPSGGRRGYPNPNWEEISVTIPVNRKTDREITVKVPKQKDNPRAK